MRKLGLSTAVVFLVGVSNAFALTASLKQNGTGLTVIPLGPGGGTFDLSIDLARLSNEVTYAGFQTSFVADAAGVSIVGFTGAHPTPNQNQCDETTTGTRYNELEWDANVNTNSGSAFNPSSWSGPMGVGIIKGPMSTLSSNDGFGEVTTGSATTSHFGHLVITIAPGSGTIHLNMANVEGATRDPETGDVTGVPAAGAGVTFLVPEPASALLLLGALPFMRRRRTA